MAMQQDNMQRNKNLNGLSSRRNGLKLGLALVALAFGAAGLIGCEEPNSPTPTPEARLDTAPVPQPPLGTNPPNTLPSEALDEEGVDQNGTDATQLDRTESANETPPVNTSGAEDDALDVDTTG